MQDQHSIYIRILKKLAMQVFLESRISKLPFYRVASLDDANQEQDDSYNEQDVNKPAYGVDTYYSE